MSKEIVLKIQINDKIYPISCREGEEKRVKKSANLVSETIKSLAEQNSGASDNRLLVMASLIIADKLEDDLNYNQKKSLGELKPESQKSYDEVFEWLEVVTLRLNKVATLLKDS
tara:strand:- start:435 stop:776 length:342 start_codon:yes stop_codon:yes gene_type:complete